ncbi:MAG: GntR family transcriptional regulator [Armatimonadia bacterium]
MPLNFLRKPSRDNSTPLYSQIIEVILEAIREGRLKPEDRLPTQEELTKHFGVSLAPVKQALSELEERGIITRRQGLGTFIRDTTPLREERILYTRIPWFTREMKERNITPKSRLLALYTFPAREESEVQHELQLGPTDRIVCLKRLRLGNDEPLSVQTSYISEARIPGLVERGLQPDESLTEIMAQQYGLEIAASQQRISATAATDEDARSLGVGVGSPLLLIQRTSYLKDGTPLEFLRDRRHPTWTFTVWLTRQ